MIETYPFKVETDRSGSQLTLYVEGELDAVTADILLATYQQESHPPASMVWVDLTAVSFCNSSGLVALQRLHQQATAAGSACKIVDPAPSVDRILQLTGLDQLIPTYRQQTANA